MELNDPLWKVLLTHGEMNLGWWYQTALMPAAFGSAGVYLLMMLALRHERRLLLLLVWLTLASMPAVCVLPSLFAAQALPALLIWTGVEPPEQLGVLPDAALAQLGGLLDRLASVGIVGMALGLILVAASVIVGLAPARLQQITGTLRNVSRSLLGARPPAHQAQLRAPHGLVRVTQGQEQHTRFGIYDGAVIGKQEASLTLSDEVVDRRHARFEVREDRSYLCDLGSQSGTFLRRGTNMQRVGVNPVALEHGDTLFLGDPSLVRAVELSFERYQ